MGRPFPLELFTRPGLRTKQVGALGCANGLFVGFGVSDMDVLVCLFVYNIHTLSLSLMKKQNQVEAICRAHMPELSKKVRKGIGRWVGWLVWTPAANHHLFTSTCLCIYIRHLLVYVRLCR